MILLVPPGCPFGDGVAPWTRPSWWSARLGWTYPPRQLASCGRVAARMAAVSTNDLIETCCAAGQQWAIDNDECLDIPESGAEDDVCRTAQKHCCVSYLKEKSCMAGVLGAKEGEACGDEDNDTWGVSLYKASCPGARGLSPQQCCDCCRLGLRVRAEGQSCESNPNLGYPCNHVMLSCCEGEDPLIVPEVRRPPEPEAVPRRVSEAELASREALSLGAETELPNSLPGDDQDECLLLPGELCQHLCINTVGSYRCACFPGFLLQDDGRTCRPDGSAPKPEAAEESAQRPESPQAAPNTIALPVPQPNTCEDQDECLLGAHDCNRRQFCVNTLGSFYCVNHTVLCAEGFILNAHRKCVDVDECELGTHDCQAGALCHNTKGSFYCQARQRCLEGFLQDPEGNCVDVNECWTSPTRLCQHTCENTLGSYRCSCASGFLLAADGKHCEDLDECALGTHNCSEAETCHNIQGGFRCLRFDCPPNYVRVSETKCERALCHDFLECQNAPARITHYRLNFQTGLLVPAHIFRISPVPAIAGDTIALTITKGNEEGYFGTRRLNAYTGVVFLQRTVRQPRDFALDVEMKLWRQGSVTTFLAKMHIFFTAFAL
ncbi:hypothetical protein Celaphus_00010672 [Cervus elaphus hippelaphus]|uniref:FBLN1 n=1 Tax=Cervus elaphus hippelaphus TaxID=46360 RepID=A0A212C9V7_CEREH|nr:hypothetical protein Celaphus_00010672 [Cervus elaphus hippelaphus]